MINYSYQPFLQQSQMASGRPMKNKTLPITVGTMIATIELESSAYGSDEYPG